MERAAERKRVGLHYKGLEVFSETKNASFLRNSRMSRPESREIC